MLPFFQVLTPAPTHICGNGVTLFLCDSCENTKHQLTAHLVSIDILPLEPYRDPDLLKVADRVHTLHHVPCKTGNALCQNQLHLTGFAVFDQTFQFRSSTHVPSAFSMVSIDPDQFKFWIFFDQLLIIGTLDFV